MFIKTLSHLKILVPNEHVLFRNVNTTWGYKLHLKTNQDEAKDRYKN